MPFTIYNPSHFDTPMMLQKPSRVEKPSGGYTTTYSDVEMIWCSVTQYSRHGATGNFGPGNSLMPETDYIVIIYYRNDIQAGMQLYDTSTDIPHVLKIQRTPVDIAYRHIYLQLECLELEAGQIVGVMQES